MQNKENIKPTANSKPRSKKPTKKPLLLGADLSFTARPEEMIQSFENLQMINAQELLREINMQHQQRQSCKQFGGLFNTLDCDAMRSNTEQMRSL